MMILGFAGVGFMAYRRRNHKCGSAPPDQTNSIVMQRDRLPVALVCGVLRTTSPDFLRLCRWHPDRASIAYAPAREPPNVTNDIL